MRFESFIASRIIRSKPYKNTISAPIIKISILSITMGLVMMIVSISSGVGLQKTIQNKISSFFGHITISNFQNQFQLIKNFITIIKMKKFYIYKLLLTNLLL